MRGRACVCMRACVCACMRACVCVCFNCRSGTRNAVLVHMWRLKLLKLSYTDAGASAVTEDRQTK